MAGSVRVEMNDDGFYKLRTSDKVRADLERRAKALADKCNRLASTTGFRTSSVLGHGRSGGRWRTTVITARAGAIRHNAAHQTLIKNMDAAGD